MAYPTAIGCGCLLGAGGAAHLWAAEWSAQPSVSWTTDYDSNRSLVATSQAQGSESAVIYGDLRLQRASESTQIVLEPKYDLRRYSDSIYGPGSDRSLNASLVWNGARGALNLSAAVANQTTLTTEVLETGIIDGQIRQRLEQFNGQWNWSRTERHQFFVQGGYLDVSYSGGPLVLERVGGPLVPELPGYKYSSGSLGERFFVSERTVFTMSAFGDVLHSPLPGNSSHEEGAQVELSTSYSERLSFDVAVGESKRSLSGQNGNGTNASVLITRTFALGNATLGYTRSLVPYGTGFLVQRQQVSAGLTRSLSPYLDANFNLIRIQNSGATALLGVDRPYYDNAAIGLAWKIGESWTVSPSVTTSWTRSVGGNQPVHEWRGALSMAWRPLASTRSR
jgi:hypothetical protein